MPPGEQTAKTQTWVVLLEVTEPAEGEPGEDSYVASWKYTLRVGLMQVPLGTQRRTVIRELLEGQGDLDAKVPQLPLGAGHSGDLFVVAKDDMGEALPVAARNRLVVEPAAGASA